MENMIQYKDETKKQLSRGEFKCGFDHEAVFLAIIAVILIVVLILCLPTIFSLVSGMERRTGRMIIEVVAISLYLVFGTMFAIILNGRTYEYNAGETEFVITHPDKHKEFFYYNDVQDIRTEELKLFGSKRGYLVTITTGVRDVQYRYIFGKNKVFTGIESTPFYYLGLNSGLYVKTNPVLDSDMDSDSINMQFESMMIEQITKKNLKAVEGDEIQKWRR